jgi:hypothetical protein
MSTEFSLVKKIGLTCDHAGCKNTPARAPRLIVQSMTPDEPGHKPIRMFTPYHFCEIHRNEIEPDTLLTPRVKEAFERCARLKRPLDYKCDFEPGEWRGIDAHGTALEFVLVTTPEYRAFMAALGVSGIYGLRQMSVDDQIALQEKLGVRELAE